VHRLVRRWFDGGAQTIGGGATTLKLGGVAVAANSDHDNLAPCVARCGSGFGATAGNMAANPSRSGARGDGRAARRAADVSGRSSSAARTAAASAWARSAREAAAGRGRLAERGQDRGHPWLAFPDADEQVAPGARTDGADRTSARASWTAIRRARSRSRDVRSRAEARGLAGGRGDGPSTSRGPRIGSDDVTAGRGGPGLAVNRVHWAVDGLAVGASTAMPVAPRAPRTARWLFPRR
jgi:hypothetical protein